MTKSKNYPAQYDTITHMASCTVATNMTTNHCKGLPRSSAPVLGSPSALAAAFDGIVALDSPSRVVEVLEPLPLSCKSSSSLLRLFYVFWSLLSLQLLNHRIVPTLGVVRTKTLQAGPQHARGRKKLIETSNLRGKQLSAPCAAAVDSDRGSSG